MSNTFTNRVSAAVAPADLTAIKTAIATIKSKLPFLIGLTNEERISIPKISEANRVFTSDAIMAVANNADMLPAYFNATELKRDLELYNTLDEIAIMLAQLTEQVSDTQMLAGSEAYVSALSAYRLFGAASVAGVAGADAIYDLLAARFANQRPVQASGGDGGAVTPPPDGA
ncbi:MAG: hypothetical protein RL660_2205 [Bacteroidota bacterium]|jgi:hypothetical protein